MSPPYNPYDYIGFPDPHNDGPGRSIITFEEDYTYSGPPSPPLRPMHSDAVYGRYSEAEYAVLAGEAYDELYDTVLQEAIERSLSLSTPPRPYEELSAPPQVRRPETFHALNLPAAGMASPPPPPLRRSATTFQIPRPANTATTPTASRGIRPTAQARNTTTARPPPPNTTPTHISSTPKPPLEPRPSPATTTPLGRPATSLPRAP